jgi:hypothetical protein
MNIITRIKDYRTWAHFVVSGFISGLANAALNYITFSVSHDTGIGGLPDPASISWQGWGIVALIGGIIGALNRLKETPLPPLATTVFLASCLLFFSACDPSTRQPAEPQITKAGKISYTDETGRKLEILDWYNTKKISIRFDSLGNPVFSSEFQPAESKAAYDVIGKIIGSNAPENILGRIIKEGFDGAGRQVNPLNPALQGLEAGDIRALLSHVSKLKSQAAAENLGPPE